MTHKILRIDLEPEEGKPSASETLDQMIEQDDLEIVSTNTYVDGFTAKPIMVLVVRPSEGDTVRSRIPLGASPVGQEADVEAFAAWVADQNADGFAVDPNQGVLIP